LSIYNHCRHFIDIRNNSLSTGFTELRYNTTSPQEDVPVYQLKTDKELIVGKFSRQ